MWEDPIVEEVREAGANLAKECGYNLHTFADMLRRQQKQINWPIVSMEDLEKLREKKGQTADNTAYTLR